MTTWTVELGSQFRATLEATLTDFQERLQKLRSTKAAEPVWQEWEEFLEFQSILFDLEDRKMDPREILKPYGHDQAGKRIFFMPSSSDRWRATFYADESKTIYYGIQIYTRKH